MSFLPLLRDNLVTLSTLITLAIVWLPTATYLIISCASVSGLVSTFVDSSANRNGKIKLILTELTQTQVYLAQLLSVLQLSCITHISTICELYLVEQ